MMNFIVKKTITSLSGLSFASLIGAQVYTEYKHPGLPIIKKEYHLNKLDEIHLYKNAFFTPPGEDIDLGIYGFLKVNTSACRLPDMSECKKGIVYHLVGNEYTKCPHNHVTQE